MQSKMRQRTQLESRHGLMRIKQLKLVGFKSFANKTIINFDENFIGVVGPNGSGKSNVIDAVRWVFGEKSNKNLRGASSSDVIFGGTEKRKKQNIAEVTIVLDNVDRHIDLEFDEVEFTRRLYRSGKSEYIINGVEVRFKDIQELILDKGIGKNAFSIISQGKIEEIITTSPENRRLLIEEVAGILKYKKRKESALNKLAKTGDNLDQVNLILNEIEERRGPLQRQALTARSYLALKEELETKELDLLATRIRENEEEINGLKVIVENENLEVIKLETAETNFELETEEQTAAANRIKSNLNELNNEINQLAARLNTKRSDLKVLTERQAHVSQNSEREQQLVTSQLSLSTELHTARNLLEDLSSKLAVKRNQESQFETQFRELRIRQNQAYNSKNDIKGELSRINVPFPTRKVLSEQIAGIIGTVESAFTVESTYSEAINTIIGGRLFEVITTDRQSATAGINFLKNNKFGRQTFLPLDAMRPGFIDKETVEKLETYSGFIGIGSNLINFDLKFEKVFTNLLGNVIVCDNLESAKYINEQLTNRYRIVSLDGDLIQTSGAMSGGRTNRQSRLVLETNLKKVDSELVQIQSQIDSLNQKNEQFTNELRALDTDYRLQYSAVERLGSEQSLITEELKAIGHEDISGQSTSITSEISDLEKKALELNGKKTKLELNLDTINEQMEANRLNVREIRESLREINLGLRDHEIKFERISTTLKNDISILREDYSMSTQMLLSNPRPQVDAKAYNTLVKDLKSKIRNLGPINVLAIDEYEELTTRFEFIDVQRADLVIAKEKLETIIRNLDEFFIEAFEKTYRKLRVEFQMVYRELFGGGNADLILTNEDDLLTTGVEIVAQPPGKKLQTISLLSGGEKALTAISLLFAILRIRSLPFAILDEVEAALDESNVKRYAQYIKVFSERTQFIVITHRQGTMEAVDALYGVTMEEKGISTTVKVTLKEVEQYV